MSDDLPTLSEDDYIRIEEEMQTLPHGRAFLREYDRRCRVIGLESFEAHMQDLKSAFEDKRPTRRQIKGLADLQSYMITVREQIAATPTSQDISPREAFVRVARDMHNLLSRVSDTLSQTAGSLEHLRDDAKDSAREGPLSDLETQLLHLSNLCSELDRDSLKVLKIVVALTEVEARLYSLGNDRSLPTPLTASEVQDMMEDDSYPSMRIPQAGMSAPLSGDEVSGDEVSGDEDSGDEDIGKTPLHSSDKLSTGGLSGLDLEEDEKPLRTPHGGLELAVEAEQEVARLLANNLDMLIMQQEGFDDSQNFDLPEDPTDLSGDEEVPDLQDIDLLLPSSATSSPENSQNSLQRKDDSLKEDLPEDSLPEDSLKEDLLPEDSLKEDLPDPLQMETATPETPEQEHPEQEAPEHNLSDQNESGQDNSDKNESGQDDFGQDDFGQQDEDDFDLDAFLTEPSPTESLPQ